MVRLNPMKKRSEGTIRKVIEDVGNVTKAIENAKSIINKYENLDIEKNLEQMNPYTTVYTLVEKILFEI